MNDTETSTIPNVFIIESLDFEDESKDYFEGQLISKILNFSDIEHQYHYIRTREEFEHFVKEFTKSKFRYLHISCHGNNKQLGTTLNTIPFRDLAFILQNALDNKRLFISACSSTNDQLADEIFGTTDCYSIVGPDNDINMNDAAIFWASFYHLMFKKNSSSMKRDVLKNTISELSKIHGIPIRYYRTSENNKRGWSKEL